MYRKTKGEQNQISSDKLLKINSNLEKKIFQIESGDIWSSPII